MASLLARRLINPVVQMENEDLTAVIAEVEQDIGEGNAVIAAGLQEIDMLGDTVDMLEAIGGSAEGLIKSDVEPDVAATVLTPALVNVLDTVDSDVAMQASVELESDSEEAKSDKGESFFKRIKDYAIKIWEAIKKAISKTVDWLRDLFNRFFDGATILNRKVKQLLDQVKSADVWNAVKFKGKGEWTVDFKDPTEKSMLLALAKHDKAMEEIIKYAENEVKNGKPRLETAIRYLEEHKDNNNDGVDRKELERKLYKLRETYGLADSYNTTKFFNKGSNEILIPVGKAADYRDNIVTTSVSYRTVSKKDGYEPGEFDSFSKNGCISILQLIQRITDSCIKLNPTYRKALSFTDALQKKVDSALKVYTRDITTISVGRYAANKEGIETEIKFLFKYVSEDLQRIYRTWNNVIKGASISSLGNVFNLMQQHYVRCTKAE